MGVEEISGGGDDSSLVLERNVLELTRRGVFEIDGVGVKGTDGNDTDVDGHRPPRVPHCHQHMSHQVLPEVLLIQ